MIIIEFNETTRTYASHANAVKAAEKAMSTQISSVRVVINTDGVRFSPVFILDRNSMPLAQPLAAQGFQVLG